MQNPWRPKRGYPVQVTLEPISDNEDQPGTSSGPPGRKLFIFALQKDSLTSFKLASSEEDPSSSSYNPLDEYYLNPNFELTRRRSEWNVADAVPNVAEAEKGPVRRTGSGYFLTKRINRHGGQLWDSRDCVADTRTFVGRPLLRKILMKIEDFLDEITDMFCAK
jgi:hypothetical protein